MIEEHVKHLCIVLSVLWETQLFVNQAKYQFVRKRVAYLGHLISSKEVEADPEKLRAMFEWPVPTSRKSMVFLDYWLLPKNCEQLWQPSSSVE